MSFLSVLLGALVGGAISSGAIIGITFLGTLVPWWALLLIAIGGTLIGGIVAGLLARGAGAGFLAGILSGLIVLLATFLFMWLYYKAQILAWIATVPDVATLVDNFLTAIGMQGTQFGLVIENWILTNAPTLPEIEAFANSKFIYFALIGGAIFGGLAAIVNAFAGLIGGAITRKKKEDYDSYY
jgi:hypothetical protein